MIETLYYRGYQRMLKTASYAMPWREPELLEGENSLSKLPKLIKDQNIESVLIVTDEGIVAAGLMDNFLDELKSEGIQFAIYDQTVPNPTIENVTEAAQLYHENYCQGIIAFGGGSPIDCAKIAGVRIAKPDKSIQQVKGLLKVLKKLPTMFIVPTTAGTGAEATLAAVVSNNKTNEKFPIMDHSLIPDFAVLDPLLTKNLPPHITSTTGMDTLTHAVEAYIGKGNTKNTKNWAIEATQLVFENIYEAYSNGDNLSARKNMQKAAYLGGKAFTRAYVGYVHAIAHTLGGLYKVPHGLANAIILPYVLEYYGESVHTPLAELADIVGIAEEGDTEEEKSDKFIQAIKDLNESMEIPQKVEGIDNHDIPIMVKRALEEGNPLYPVPKVLFKNDIHNLYQIIKA